MISEHPVVPEIRTAAPPHACSNCDAGLHGPYCHACGQRRPRPEDESLITFLRDAATDLLNTEGKALRTVASLVLRPGELTADHLRGRRVRYLRPVSLFLFVNVLFILLAVRAGLFDHTLYEYRFYGPPDPEAVRALVDAEMARTGLSMESYEESFNRNADVLRKSMIALLVPLFALVAWLLYFRRRPHFLPHLVFSTHFFTFFWLFITLAGLPLAVAVEIAGVESPDEVLAPMIMGAALVYLALALRRIHGEGWIVTAMKAGALAFAVAALLQLYRVLMFYGAYWTT